ncbi:TPA: hypothetical protein DCZ16_00865 [Candidatus Peregrinibacteria bacterium]|nr:hypothetical protein [Candidatus Peregrinibacteria bacterium]
MENNVNKLGLEGLNDTFKMGGNSSAPATSQNPTLNNISFDGDAPIILNISSGSVPKKLLQLEKLKQMKFTGNPIIDFFYKANDYLILHTKIKAVDLSTFFRLLAIMINAGVPLIKALDTLAEQNVSNIRLGKIIYDLARKVEQGKSLSDSMKLYSDVFDESQIGMVKSGEASGQLVKTLSNIAGHLEKSVALGSKLKGAMIYPIVILVVLAAVVTALMMFVIPGMKDFFMQSGGQELPAITQVVIGLSDFMIAYWYLLFGGIFGAIFLFAAWKKTATGKYLWDGFVLKIPVIGNLVKKTVLAEFAKSFSDLIGAGIPLISALKIIANSTKNSIYKEKITLAAKDIEQGIPLAETFNDPKLIPPMLTDMIAIGEQTAQLENVTEKVAGFYEEEVDNMVKGLLKGFEPLIMVVMGIVVGGIVAAIMLPIMQMSSSVGNM